VVKLYLSKSTYSEDHILASKGCCISKFLYALENDRILLVRPTRNWGPLRQFF